MKAVVAAILDAVRGEAVIEVTKNLEDEDDLESTKAVYDVLTRIVSEGHKLDLLDYCEGYGPDIKT